MTDRDFGAGETIGVVARQLGVSVRTLHHWDDQKVASPSARTSGGYRAYSAEDVARLRRVLMLRDLDVPLDRIRFLLSASAAERRQELADRRVALDEKIRRLQAAAKAVDQMLTADETGILLSETEQKRVLGDGWNPLWSAAARERWGDSAQWAEYAERSAHRTADDWLDITESMHGVHDDLASAKRAGTVPGSDCANSLAERHRDVMSSYFYCTHSMHVLIARRYVSDQGFSDFNDGMEPGLAEWLMQVIDANARAHGIEPETAEWE
ncbi:MerR family transcriptional regulator [Mycetocola zhadangensis]|uniref:MerR family transcriptional regulator n=1 Tax=Mycetocola zhadangensis TaxID=1164595 RepID=UPI0019CB868D|nr:MerR family transcriptional regulator [Mycetocola zhadangensis]GGF01700.1 MerR family transcriptional regulator [Mycetocola zhadangensis]